MRTARKAGVPFSAITQVNRSNLSELTRIRDLLTYEGAYAWQVQPAVKMGELCGNQELAPRPSDIVAISRVVARLIEESGLKIYAADSLGYFGPHEKVLRKHAGGTRFGGCEAGLENVGIESNGDVKGCLALLPGLNPRRGDFVEGNVKDTALERIWSRPGAFAYNRDFRVEDLDGFCRTCTHALLCRGGCRSCLAASGSGAGNPMCEHRVLSERRSRGGLARPAAAAILASALSMGAQGCRSVGPINGENEKDAGADTDTDSEFQGAYGFPDTDTETEVDTDPDAGVDAGGVYIYTQQLPD
jgi:radical SAM protein with 4Fe4S-binding SPASM domain